MPTPPDLITQIARLIAEPSVSSTQSRLDQGNLGVIHLLAQWLSDLGFDTEILPLALQPHKANLIASLGKGPGGLVLAGHTDTVPFDEHRWRSNPLRLSERDNRLYGLGTCDMKGFFALVIEAARGFRAKDLQQPLVVLATADEESSMAGAMALVELGRPKARYAVIGEPTGMRPVYQHKSILMESIEVVGQAGHSSNPALGSSALEAMQEVIQRLLLFREKLQRQFNNPKFEVQVPTLNLGCIHGGDNPNRICSSCELHFDLRLLPGMSNQAVRGEIAATIQEVASARNVSISMRSLINGVEAFAEREDAELIQAARQITGYGAETTAFATEAPYLQQLGLETVVLGPGNIAQAHQPDEYLALDTLQPCISALRQLIQRFCLPASS